MTGTVTVTATVVVVLVLVRTLFLKMYGKTNCNQNHDRTHIAQNGLLMDRDESITFNIQQKNYARLRPHTLSLSAQCLINQGGPTIAL